METTQQNPNQTTLDTKISVLDDFHAVLKACGRLSADTLAVIEDELGIHKAGLADSDDAELDSDEDPAAEATNSTAGDTAEGAAPAQ